MPGQDVDDDVGRVDALGHRMRAGRFHRWQSVGQHSRQNGDHLPITIVRAGEAASHAFQFINGPRDSLPGERNDLPADTLPKLPPEPQGDENREPPPNAPLIPE